jgi:hypothetical protein
MNTSDMTRDVTYQGTVSLATLKSACIVVSRHIPRTSHCIINMLTVPRSIRTRFASFDAELGSRHEVLFPDQMSQEIVTRLTYRPFKYLFKLAERA